MPNEANLCNMTISGKDSYLDSESKSYLNIYLESDSIYFKNQLNDTLLFEVVNRVDSLVPYTEFSPCLSDTTMITYREGVHQQLYITLYSADLNIYFYYRIINQSLTDLLVSDILWIAKGFTKEFVLADVVNNSNFLSEFATFNPIDEPTNPFVTQSDSMEINQKVFYNVIEPNPNNTGLPNNEFPNPLVKYTKELGIISIIDSNLGTNLTYCYSK
jgi:hypothetical protein